FICAASESRQALRAVVGDLHTRDLLERTVRLRRVAHQLRGIPVDLVEIGAIRRQPAIARAAAHDSIDRSEGAISRNNRARGILRDGELFAVDAEAAEVAVAEGRRIYESVIRGDGEPAQLRRQAPARVDLHEWADVDLAVAIDGCHGAGVADSICDDEGIRPAVQEGDVEGRGPLRVLKLGFAKGAVLSQGEYDDAVGVWCIRSDDV